MSLNEFTNSILPVKNKLYRFALSIVGDIAEAEDIVQEVLIKIWNKREEIDRIINREAWCMQLTKNLSLDKLRSKHKKNSSLENAPDVVEHAATPYQVAENNDLMQQIQNRIHQLPEKQRMVMTLRDIEGMSYQEICEVLDMSLQQVKTNLFRARNQVRAWLLKSESYGLPGN